MIHNRGTGNVVDLRRITSLGLEPPPNDFDIMPVGPPFISALGGRTAPSAPGGFIPPQNRDGVVVVTTRAPECRQDYTNDGGSITATPSASIRRQEAQRGVVSALGDWKDAQVFDPPQVPDEGQKKRSGA